MLTNNLIFQHTYLKAIEPPAVCDLDSIKQHKLYRKSSNSSQQQRQQRATIAGTYTALQHSNLAVSYDKSSHFQVDNRQVQFRFTQYDMVQTKRKSVLVHPHTVLICSLLAIQDF